MQSNTHVENFVIALNMQSGDFRVSIRVGAQECGIETFGDNERYVALNHGDEYTVRLENSGDTLCDAKLFIDGNMTQVGVYRVPARSTIDVERPLFEARKFTFVRDTSDAAVRAGGVPGQNLNGVVTVAFYPEKTVAKKQEDEAKLKRVVEAVEKQKKLLTEEMDKVLSRGETLHVLVDKSEVLDGASSLHFGKQCKKSSVSDKGSTGTHFLGRIRSLWSSSNQPAAPNPGVATLAREEEKKKLPDGPVEETKTPVSGLTVLCATSQQTFTSVPGLSDDQIDLARVARVTIQLKIRDAIDTAEPMVEPDGVAISALRPEQLLAIS